MIIYVLYYAVWGACCLFYAIFPIDIYPPLSTNLLATVFGLPILGGLIQSPFPIFALRTKKLPRIATLSQVMRLIFFIWLLISSIELVSAKSLPILSLGSNTYTEYGTKGIGGLLNALGFVFAPYFFNVFISSKRFRDLIPAITLLIYQLVTLRRGHLVAFCVVIFLSSYILSSRKNRYYAPCLLLSLGAIIVFGVLGDLRGNENPFLSLYSGKTLEILSSLPSGFTWFLAYFTGPLGNLSANLDTLFQTCNNYFYPFWQLMPTPLKAYLGSSELGCQGVDLVNDSMNVGTYFMGILQSSVFAPFYFSFLVYVIRVTMALHSRKPSILTASAVAVLAYCVLSTVFSDTFFLPTYATAVAILLYLSSSPYSPASAKRC
jgi:hypothetical protein